MGLSSWLSGRYDKAIEGLTTKKAKRKAIERTRIDHAFYNALAELVTDVGVAATTLYTAYEALKRGDDSWHFWAHMGVGYAGTKVFTRVYDCIYGYHPFLDKLFPSRIKNANEQLEETFGKRETITIGSIAVGAGIEIAQQEGIIGGTRSWDGFARTLASAAVANGTSAAFDWIDDTDALVYEQKLKEM